MTPRESGRLGGLRNKGDRNPMAKLTESDVREILASAGTYEAIAERFSIHPTYVWKLKTKKRWSHLDE